MAVKKILKMGDERLLRVAHPVVNFGSLELKQLIIDMFDTMRAYDGVGLAAPQIGVNQQIIIFGFEDDDRAAKEDKVPQTILINPRLSFLSEERDEIWEGCLSVPGLRGLVPRYTHIHYSGYDADGNVIQRDASGFHARVVQHEYDHLMGRLYPTRIEDMTQFGYVDALHDKED